MNARANLVYVSAGVTLTLGLLGLLNPALTVRMLGLELVDPRGLSQARATFGALHVTLGAVLLWAAAQRSVPAAYLWLPTMLLGSIAVGRLLSILIDGAITFPNVAFLASEAIVTAGALMAAWDRSRRPNANAGALGPGDR
ncbi:MAG: DUF4345 family protein [Trueperaceae bacterium]